MEKYLDLVLALISQYGLNLFGAIIALVLGLWVIKWLGRLTKKMLHKRKVDESLLHFFHSLLINLLRVLLFVSVLGMLGIQMTSFIAIIGAAGLAIGLALSGTLQNFAGGVIILLLKPFKVGDYIEAESYTGIVKEIQVFNTILTTVDNKTVILPNGTLSNSSMINYTHEEKRRVDWVFGIAYGDNLDKAKSIIREQFDSDDRILRTPDYMIVLGEMADSSVNIYARAWVKTEEYWPVYFAMNEQVYKAFNAQGINIPFPQMDVHLHQKDN